MQCNEWMRKYSYPFLFISIFINFYSLYLFHNILLIRWNPCNSNTLLCWLIERKDQNTMKSKQNQSPNVMPGCSPSKLPGKQAFSSTLVISWSLWSYLYCKLFCVQWRQPVFVLFFVSFKCLWHGMTPEMKRKKEKSHKSPFTGKTLEKFWLKAISRKPFSSKTLTFMSCVMLLWSLVGCFGWIITGISITTQFQTMRPLSKTHATHKFWEYNVTLFRLWLEG